MPATVLLEEPGENLHDEIRSLYLLFQGMAANEPLHFDLSALKWGRPTIILAIAAYLRDVVGSTYEPPLNLDMLRYLRTVGFPDGVIGMGETDATRAVGRNYSPIGVLVKDGGMERYRLENIFQSDEEAILSSLRGISSKNETSRGYGVSTSRRLVCEGLDGSFAIVSGNAMLLADASEEHAVTLTDFHWQGTIVCWHMKKPVATVDYSKFIE